MILGALAAISAVGILACGGSTAPAVLDVSGTWSYSDSVTAVAQNVTCLMQGTLVIDQTGAKLIGPEHFSGSCKYVGGATEGHVGDGTMVGSVDGSQVSFTMHQASLCDFNGSISGNPPNRMAGSVTCEGTTQRIGTFLATK